MSIEALNWAMSLDLKNPGQKLVTIVLANYANDDCNAWPNQATLTKKCSMGLRTVQKHISDLAAIGVITIIKNYTGSHTHPNNIYRLNMQRKLFGDISPDDKNHAQNLHVVSFDEAESYPQIPPAEIADHTQNLRVVCKTTRQNRQNHPPKLRPNHQEPNTHSTAGRDGEIVTSEETLIAEVFTPDDECVARCVQRGCPAITQDHIWSFIAHHKKMKTRCHDWQWAFVFWMGKEKQFTQQRLARDRGNDAIDKKTWTSTRAPNSAQILAAGCAGAFGEQFAEPETSNVYDLAAEPD